jgi:hypothetical protein
MHSDPILREVHRIKDKLAREVGYDVEKMFDRLREAAKKHPERMVHPAPKSTAPKKRLPATRKTAK